MNQQISDGEERIIGYALDSIAIACLKWRLIEIKSVEQTADLLIHIESVVQGTLKALKKETEHVDSGLSELRQPARDHQY